ncbi:MAG: hypothetical protein I3I94_08970 [Acidaminococcaceae bacterium]|nr:hypothetical protein [Acidaminococcaceae bacterium]
MEKSPIYENSDGWRFSVATESGYDDNYNKVTIYGVQYHKPGSDTLRSAPDAAPWRTTRQEAETDLAEYAKKRGLVKVEA